MAAVPVPSTLASLGLSLEDVVEEHGGTVWRWQDSPPFCVFSCKDHLQPEQYPPGVSWLRYGEPEAWWAWGEGASWPVSSLAQHIQRKTTARGLVHPWLLDTIATSTLLTSATGSIQAMAVAAFAKTILEHLAHHMQPSAVPVNCRAPLDMFRHPVFAWRLVEQGGGGLMRRRRLVLCACPCRF